MLFEKSLKEINIMSEALWGLIGTIVGAVIGHFSASILWKKQYIVDETRRKTEEASKAEELKMKRFNYLNDLLIECNQNEGILSDYNRMRISGQKDFGGLNIGNIEKFERDYPSIFVFSEVNRIAFHKMMNGVKKFAKRTALMDNVYGKYLTPLPYPNAMGDDLYNEQLSNVQEFKSFISKAIDSDCDFKF